MSITSQALEAIRKVDIFQAFSEDDKTYLSNHAKQHRCPPGHTIVREGESGDSLFVVANGLVSVWMNLGESSLNVASLGAGSFFGEMALLTGKPRTATVVAETGSELLEITKHDIAPLLAREPEVSKRISEVLAERQKLNRSRLQRSEEESKTQLSHQFLNEIRDVFGLKDKG